MIKSFIFILLIICVSLYSYYVYDKYNKLEIKTHINNDTPTIVVTPEIKDFSQPEQLPVNDIIEKTSNSMQMKVLNIIYIPSSNNQIDLSETGALNITTANSLVEYVNSITTQSLSKLTEGSRYHQYKKSFSNPLLQYSLIDTKVYYENLPSGLPLPWKENTNRPDYKKILEKENICNYVDNMNLKEVWVWGYHTEKIEPVESNMSMGKKIKEKWNKNEYGDVSNSEMSDDLPICNKTYVLFNLNYGRGVGEVLENHTHHIEAVNNYIHSDLWNKFVGVSGDQEKYSCGWTHYPPNVMKYTTGHDYDWYNTRSVMSDCTDWKPDGTGKKELVSCSTWSKNNCEDDGGVAFKVWWMQNIPALDDKVGNWWKLIGDFDDSIK